MGLLSRTSSTLLLLSAEKVLRRTSRRSRESEIMNPSNNDYWVLVITVLFSRMSLFRKPNSSFLENLAIPRAELRKSTKKSWKTQQNSGWVGCAAQVAPGGISPCGGVGISPFAAGVGMSPLAGGASSCTTNPVVPTLSLHCPYTAPT